MMWRCVAAMVISGVMGANAHALSCVQPDFFSHNTVFFEGTVTAKAPAGKEDTTGMNRTFRYTVRVDKPWHGAEAGEEFSYQQSFWYANGYEVGETAHFAFPDTIRSGEMMVGMCGFVRFNPRGADGELVPEFAARLKALQAGDE